VGGGPLSRPLVPLLVIDKQKTCVQCKIAAAQVFTRPPGSARTGLSLRSQPAPLTTFMSEKERLETKERGAPPVLHRSTCGNHRDAPGDALRSPWKALREWQWRRRA